MRVLVLHRQYWPEIVATAQILSDICDGLVAPGPELTVLCRPDVAFVMISPPLLLGLSGVVTTERRDLVVASESGDAAAKDNRGRVARNDLNQVLTRTASVCA